MFHAPQGALHSKKKNHPNGWFFFLCFRPKKDTPANRV